MVVPGTRPITSGHGPRVGPVGGDADHRQVPRRADRRAHGARSMDPLETVAFARALIDIDSTTGREREAGEWLAGVLRELGYTVVEQPLGARLLQRPRDARRARRRALHALRLRAAVLSQPASRTARCTGAARATRRASWPRRSRRPSGCARAASAGSACCSSSARSAAATARRWPTLHPSGSRFLINGEPTDNRLGDCDARRAAAAAARARTRLPLGFSRARRVGDRQADRRADAAADAAAAAETPSCGATYYSVGLIEGGVAPNVISPHASAEVLFRHRRPRRRGAGGDQAARRPPWRSKKCCGCRRCSCTRSRASIGGVLRSPPTSRCSALGHAAASRARFDSRCAHRRGTARSRGDGGRHRDLRAPGSQTPPRRSEPLEP